MFKQNEGYSIELIKEISQLGAGERGPECHLKIHNGPKILKFGAFEVDAKI